MNILTRLQHRLNYFSSGLVFICLLFSFSAAASALDQNELPKPLREWTQWVAKGHETLACPFWFNDWNARDCAWPSTLQLNLNDKGGSFSQSWRVYSDSWVALPGNSKSWPQQVSVNKKAALVVEHSGLPMMYLEAGQYQVQGRFEWNQAPTTLPIPRQTGIVNLTLNNKVIEFPRREQSALWLQAVQNVKSVNQFNFQVFRHIDDDIPAQITFYLALQVSGVARQESIQLPIAEGFTPLQLSSSLPSRLNDQNQLTLQVRPGNWSVSIVYRYNSVLSELSFDKPKQAWVDEEVWVFQSRPALRMVDLSGLESIDPQQTELPSQWKELPAYRATPGSRLQFSQQRRGDPNPGDDQLQLQRDIWLSFDGSRYTLLDSIQGSKKTQWRMEVMPPLKLGQVSVDGRDQFITQLADSDRAGIEIREGQVNIQATSELHNDSASIPATGWAQNFQQVGATLHLPPGYRVFSVSGADTVSSTWMTRWTLLDIFLVLLITIAIAKLRERWIAALAFVTLLLTYHENDAPVYLWLLLVIGIALLKVLKSGKLRKLVLIYYYLITILLFIVIVPFFIQQIRTSIYPQLELHDMQFMPDLDTLGTMSKPRALRPTEEFERRRELAQPEMAPEPLNEPMPSTESDESGVEALEQKPMISQYAEKSGMSTLESLAPRKPAKVKKFKPKSAILRYDPQAVKQTGPGLPRWQWRNVYITWNGPVDQQQQIHVMYLTPAVNTVLACLRILLIMGLLLALYDFDFKNRRLRAATNAAASVLIGGISLAFFMAPTATQAQQFPSESLLKELENRLIEPAKCLPNCASLADMQIDIRADRLSVDMTVNNLELNAIPLPGDPNHWHIDKIIVDGVSLDTVLSANNRHLYIGLSKGQHHVRLQGKLSADNKQQFEMPLKPYRIDVNSQGWEVAGVHPDGSADQQLQFSRAEKNAEKLEFDSAQLPAFVNVERRLIFGLNWTVQTRVQRLSPIGAAIVLNLPLLDGESVITPDIKVEAQVVKLNMAANQSQLAWESNLAMSESNNQARGQIKLSAAQTTQWVENWEIDVSPIWHLQYEGIPVIRHQSGNIWKPTWQPWPGESLTLNISRPGGVSGQNLTIDHSVLELTPGLRLTDAVLNLSLRSSQGAKHTLKLPANSQLQQVMANGRVLPLRLEQDNLVLPINPGKQDFNIQFQVPTGISGGFRSFPVDLGIASVNHEIMINMPSERWILFVNGPLLGPAVLFWGELIVILILAYPLSRLRKSIPLKYWQWSLLILGLLPISLLGMLVVLLWFILLSVRENVDQQTSKRRFNILQITIVAMTIASVIVLGISVSMGLLGAPDMHVTGNGSYNSYLKWYQDIVTPQPPNAYVVSVPMYIYRVFMLLWALWMAFSIVKWSQWGWRSFSKNGYWRSFEISLSGRLTQSPPTANQQKSDDG